MDTFSNAIRVCQTEATGGKQTADALVQYNMCMLRVVQDYGPEALSDTDELYYKMAGEHLLARARSVQSGKITIEEYNRDDQETSNTLAKWQARDAAQERYLEVSNARRQETAHADPSPLDKAQSACWTAHKDGKGNVKVSELPAYQGCVLASDTEYGPAEYSPMVLKWHLAADKALLQGAHDVVGGKLSPQRLADLRMEFELKIDVAEWRFQHGLQPFGEDKKPIQRHPQLQSRGVCDEPGPACNAAMALATQRPPQAPAYEYRPVALPEPQQGVPIVPIRPLHLQPSAPEAWPTPARLPQTYTIQRWSNGETVTGPQGPVAQCQNWSNSVQCMGN